MLQEIAASFALLFFAELGDKTQFLTLSLASRFSAARVALGAFLASFALTAIAVAFGSGLSALFSNTLYLDVGAGALFVAFGLYTLIGRDDDDDDGDPRDGSKAAVWATFTAIFVAELGDKTQVATIARASTSAFPLGVLVGATLGFFLSNAAALVVGRAASTRLSPRQLRVGSALIFLAFGLSYLARAFL